MKKIFKKMFNPDGKNMIPKDQDIIAFLVLNGGLEVAGVDSETGELLYCFTEKIKDIMPELYKDHLQNVNSELMRLWEKGYVNIDILSDTDPVITLTPLAFDQDALKKLSKQDRWSIEEIKRLSSHREF